MLNTTFAYQQKAGVNNWENVAFTMFDIFKAKQVLTRGAYHLHKTTRVKSCA